jgi:hypothetical protein
MVLLTIVSIAKIIYIELFRIETKVTPILGGRALFIYILYLN